MKNTSIFGFIFAMWILMIIGGGLLVLVLGPINFSGAGILDSVLSSGIKGIISICLVIIWIFVLSKMTKWIFYRKVGSTF